LLFDGVTAIVTADGGCRRSEDAMGDKSPKSKERGKKQKDAVRVQGAAAAKTKQAGQSYQPTMKGKK
jgi:hypothetical protein